MQMRVSVVVVFLATAPFMVVTLGFGDGVEFGGSQCVSNQNCTNCISGLREDKTGCPNAPNNFRCIVFGKHAQAQHTFKTCVDSDDANDECNATTIENPKAICQNVKYWDCKNCVDENGNCDGEECKCPPMGEDEDGKDNFAIIYECT